MKPSRQIQIKNLPTKKNKTQLNLSKKNILIADEDHSYLLELQKILVSFGAKVFLAVTEQEANQILNNEKIDILLSHESLKSGQGTNLIEPFLQKKHNGLFYLTFFPSIETDLSYSEWIRKGVQDCFVKPLPLDKFLLSLEKSLNYLSNTPSLSSSLIKDLSPYLIFCSQEMQKALSLIPTMARSNQPVLITGETGTGKELVARTIHELSQVSAGSFIALNCGAIPETLIESELFGHEKGSFTGAEKNKKGKFALAENGSIFLDELGTMPLHLQVRLLRVLEEKRYYPVGSEKDITTNARIIAGTAANLEKAVENKSFRDDLYYRLNVLRIHLPPLRERQEDIPLLALYFLEKTYKEMELSLPYPRLSEDAILLLKKYPWKGNVREIRNVMTRVAILNEGKIQTLSAKNLAFFYPEFSSTLNSDIYYKENPKSLSVSQNHNLSNSFLIEIGSSLEEIKNLAIEKTLIYTKGNQTKAAEILGIHAKTISRVKKLKK